MNTRLFNQPGPSLRARRRTWAVSLACLLGLHASATGAFCAASQEGPGQRAVTVSADARTEQPVRAILEEFRRRTGAPIAAQFLSPERVAKLVENGAPESDVLVLISNQSEPSPLASLPGAIRVAWRHPGGDPVWAAAATDDSHASTLVRFLGGPTGHLFWARSPAGFTITTGKTHAEAFAWVAEHRVGHTYRVTALRMLREIGGTGEGVCIDIGCGPGHLAVELAKRSRFEIVGLDIDAQMKPLFERNLREAGMADRARFVEGDARKMPFADDSADVVVSRGTLIFIPDIARCLREVDRVLKPSGVAFLGGRYLYTPHAYRISSERLREIVRGSGVEGAQVIEARGQWVKIIGPKAPQAARNVATGPHLLAHRVVADYAVSQGDCLLICPSDAGAGQSLQQGFLEMTGLRITVLYPTEEIAAKARGRIRAGGHSHRVRCTVGEIHHLPLPDDSFDVIAGVGPLLLWGDREKGMREVYRVLREGGVALIGGRYLSMPEWRKVDSDTLRASAAKTGITSIRVLDDFGQWIEIRKRIHPRELHVYQAP